MTDEIDVEQMRKDIQAFTRAVEVTVEELYEEIRMMREKASRGQD